MTYFNKSCLIVLLFQNILSELVKKVLKIIQQLLFTELFTRQLPELNCYHYYHYYYYHYHIIITFTIIIIITNIITIIITIIVLIIFIINIH